MPEWATLGSWLFTGPLPRRTAGVWPAQASGEATAAKKETAEVTDNILLFMWVSGCTCVIRGRPEQDPET